MKNLTWIILLGATFNGLAASFTPFYVQTTGSNLNAGSTTADAALVTSTNGNWDSTTGVFICGGATDLSAVTTGMWASVYIDGATVGVFVGRITAVVDGTDTITVSLAAMSGTPPTTSATARTIKVGGAWKGFNGAESFPIGFLANTSVNSSGHVPKVFVKGGVTYAITAAMTAANAGPMIYEGYTTTPGDNGRATIDGAGAAAGIIMLTVSGANRDFANLIFANNGPSGTTAGVSVTAGSSEANWYNCVFSGMRAQGIIHAGTSGSIEACEAFGCNLSNTAATGAIQASGVINVTRCFSHDNTGSNTSGFRDSAGSTYSRCIADSNGRHGLLVTGVTGVTITSCDFYNNASSAIDMTGATGSSVQIRNCNFLLNGGWAVDATTGPTFKNGSIRNCGFGSGTQANTSGDVNPAMTSVEVLGSVTYAANVTPWLDPANGDFRITLRAAQQAGILTFTQTAPSYAGTLGFIDIGAAQSKPVGFSYAFTQ